jgi:DNA-binding transcriptional LysR family regulator
LRDRELQKNTSRLAWDDLRTVLEVARAGSLSGAARALGVEHSTVHRRLAALERRLRVRLFDRDRSGYAPRPAAEGLIEAAEAIEQTVLAAERRMLGTDEQLAGEIRLATSEILGSYLVPHLLGGFLLRHPAIGVEIGISNRSVDLVRREADLALRVTDDPPEHLIARRVGTITYAVYGAPALLRRTPRPQRLAELPWLGFDDSLSSVAQARWLRAHPPDEPPRTRWGSLISLIHATASGLGVAALTCLAAMQHRGLVRMSEVLGEIPLYVLTHPDVRSNARVRTLSHYIADCTPSIIARLARSTPVRLLQV